MGARPKISGRGANMNRLKKVCFSSLMGEIDRFVIEEVGIKGVVLMERAGWGVVKKIFENYLVENKEVWIFCGPGNNGGDGFVAARYLKNFGAHPVVFLLSPEEKYKNEAKTNLEILKKLNISLISLYEESQVEDFEKRLGSFFPALIVDALFGTGLKREIKGHFGEVINFINKLREERGIPIVSIDIASGVNGDNGQILGCAVRSDLTVTFEYFKPGHFLYPGKEHCGKVELVEIGFPWKVVEKRFSLIDFVDENYAKRHLKPRQGYTHKGRFGHVLVLSGSRGKSGAGLLTALGALKSGAGLVTLASTKELQKIYSTALPEALTHGFEENLYGEISEKVSEEELIGLLKNKTTIVIGPGFGLREGAERALRLILENAGVPLVIDADAITLLSKKEELLNLLRAYQAPKIITPHPGEAERLVKISKAEIFRDRISAVKTLARTVEGIAILKGPHTLICEYKNGDYKLAISSIDEPGLSQGGMGDVLSGIIGGFLAQGYEPFQATCLSVFIHGFAGKILSQSYGPWGYTARDLAQKLPEIFKILLSSESG